MWRKPLKIVPKIWTFWLWLLPFCNVRTMSLYTLFYEFSKWLSATSFIISTWVSSMKVQTTVNVMDIKVELQTTDIKTWIIYQALSSLASVLSSSSLWWLALAAGRRAVVGRCIPARLWLDSGVFDRRGQHYDNFDI